MEKTNIESPEGSCHSEALRERPLVIRCNIDYMKWYQFTKRIAPNASWHRNIDMIRILKYGFFLDHKDNVQKIGSIGAKYRVNDRMSLTIKKKITKNAA